MTERRHAFTALRRNEDRRREQRAVLKGFAVGLLLTGAVTAGLLATTHDDANWSLIARLDGQEYVEDTGTREDCLAWVAAKEKLWGTDVVFYCAKEKAK